MKKLLIILGIVCATAIVANGQYSKAMAKNVPSVFQASTPEDLQSTINQLSRIGDAEGDKWEPYYYVAFGYIKMQEMYEAAEDKDKYLDLALESVKKGEEINPGDSELESLRGYVHMMRVVVDPATRGMMYSGMAMASFQKAVKLNPDNPRAHYLLGRMQFGTAQFMGTGDGGACESFFKSMLLFDKEDTSGNPFAPSWGKETNKAAMEQICEGE